MASKIHLVICHRSLLLRECLLLALGEDAQMDVTIVDERNVEAFVPPLQEGLYLLLIDASLPNMMAFRFVQTLRTTNPAARTIFLVSSSSPDLIAASLQAGADGCILEDDALDDLRQAIEIVMSGRNYCSPKVAYHLFTQNGRLGQPSRRVTCEGDCRLTRREIDVLRLIAHRHLGNKQIAKELRVSICTVKNHVHSIISKLNVEDRQMAAHEALRQGLLSSGFGDLKVVS
jgi:two-component system, NarL family, response regulator LiaR